MRTIPAQIRFLVIVLFSMMFSANAATWYVDSSVLISGNGTTWLTAWQNLSDISGVTAGDIVYISGGPSGSSQTYSLSGTWSPAGGNSSANITYQIGQDSLHDGTAKFSGPGGQGQFLAGVNYVTLTGNAGDGKMHFQVSGFSQIMDDSGNLTSFQLSYINFGSMVGNTSADGSDSCMLRAGNGGDGAFANHFQLDHCYAFYNDPNGTYMFWWWFNGGANWGANKIFNNTFVTYTCGGGYGPEITDSAGNSGYDFYSNVCYAVYTNYSSVSHQDGWYDTGGSEYERCFDNIFCNFNNSTIVAWGVYGGFENVYIYNNIICNDNNLNSSDAGGNYSSIVVQPFNGGTGPFGGTCVNVVVANNITVDYGGYGAFFTGNNGSYVWTMSGCVCANNIMLNSGSINTSDYSGILEDNVSLSSSQALTDFVSYTVKGGTNNNFNLLATAQTLIGKGANLSTYFTQDFVGFFRPAVTNWDIGPYQYNDNSSETLPAPSTPNIELISP
jgi:hypothetical protein